MHLPSPVAVVRVSLVFLEIGKGAVGLNRSDHVRPIQSVGGFIGGGVLRIGPERAGRDIESSQLLGIWLRTYVVRTHIRNGIHCSMGIGSPKRECHLLVTLGPFGGLALLEIVFSQMIQRHSGQWLLGVVGIVGQLQPRLDGLLDIAVLLVALANPKK